MAGMRNPTAVDSEARLRGLWDAHHHAVTKYCRRRTSLEDARDAVAETFAIAWQKLDQVPEGESARFWLYGVAGRVLSNQRRTSSRRTSFLQRSRAIDDPEPSAEMVVIRRAEEQKVIDAASHLSRTDREILLLAAWEELPHAEIGEVLDLSPAAVAQRLARAKKRLAKEFGRMSAPEEGVA